MILIIFKIFLEFYILLSLIHSKLNIDIIELEPMKSNIPKTCKICQDTFYPHKQVEKRQKVCDKLSCKRINKKRSQDIWKDKNPQYYTGRYPELKEQILENKKKKKQPKLKTQPSSGIQDELTCNKNSLLIELKDMKGIQDELTKIITKNKRHLNSSLKMVYKIN